MATAPHTLASMSQICKEAADWVSSVAQLTEPERVHWCEGSRAELQRLQRELLSKGELLALDPQSFPGCTLYRSNPNDVARVEHLTFICTNNKEDAGPNNNWMAPDEAKARLENLFRGCMRGRTLYVIPYCMGPIDSPYSRCGIEITDSAYVVLNMAIMTRMGRAALERLSTDGEFVRGVHSTGDLNPERRFIMHFPQENLIQSFGSGYGGNALLGKKCHALRLASWQARKDSWLAEHMLIVGLQSPRGQTHYVAAAFPSACGKTNLSMLIPPESMPGWKVFTVGDDIAWLHPGPDGRLWAINPEAGYFGVVPGTNAKSNRNAYETIRRDTIFTNVALTADREPWWEGLEGQPAIDWKGRAYDPANGPAAHPNARFTVSATQNPSYSRAAEDPRGVPISALVFGGRRRELAPLVYEARSWSHGVLVGASVASETTAAATGQVGVVRRDPMAMKPFCGYNFGDYWSHWLDMGARLKSPPRLFHVNWFRQSGGKFLWPGFGENLRVLAWMLDRCEGRIDAADTAIGYMPKSGDINTNGLDISAETMRELFAVPQDLWRREITDLRDYLRQYGTRLPPQMLTELEETSRRIEAGK